MFIHIMYNSKYWKISTFIFSMFLWEASPPPLELNGSRNHFNKQAVFINLMYRNNFTDWNERKNYRIWFLPTSGISSSGIWQSKTISVNWLLCYGFFEKSHKKRIFFLNGKPVNPPPLYGTATPLNGTAIKIFCFGFPFEVRSIIILSATTACFIILYRVLCVCTWKRWFSRKQALALSLTL